MAASKSVMNTGASTGIGYATAEALARAYVVVLSASVETIVGRCRGGDRPLLAPTSSDGDPSGPCHDNTAAERVRRLLAERASVYRAGHLFLTTDEATPDALAERLARRWIAAGEGATGAY